MSEILTTLMTYLIVDGIDPEEYAYEAATPREAVEDYLETYDWRRDLDADYGDQGLEIDGEVRDTNGRTLATFRATPEGIKSFTELPR